MIDPSSAADYVYARTSGKLSKSFVGARANKLFQVKSLSELWQLVFNTEVPVVPETILAQMLEKNAEKRFVSEFVELLNFFSEPDPISLQMLRLYDYSNLKEINFVLRTGGTKLPEIVDIGQLSRINYKAWPKLSSMTQNSPFSWYREPVFADGVQDFEHRLDTEYIKELWQCVKQYQGEQRMYIEKVIREEIILKNIIWAIRLRVYYNMNAEMVMQHLVWDTGQGRMTDALAGPAMKILSIPLDSHEEWEKWKYSYLLNPAAGDLWTVDPRWVQRVANISMNKRALQMFHVFPCSSVVLVPWFKIKQHELDYIRTAAEAVRLNVDSQAAKSFAGLM